MPSAPTTLQRIAVPVICAVFFLSGASALILEIAWTRQLELLLGNSIDATTTMIAVYMLGLGIGARLGAGLTHRETAPLRIYAALEGLLILWTLLVPLLLAWVTFLLPLLGGLPGLHSDAGTPALLRIFASVSIFAVPTLLMGATLPVLTHAVASRAGVFATRFSFLYGANTLGAVAGSLGAGFFLLPAIGVGKTIFFALGLNLLAAVAAILLSRLAAFRTTPLLNREEPDAAAESSPRALRLLTVIAALAGFLALTLEVFWFRTLVLIFGSTTYSFSAMLAIFLAGTAVGPLLLGWIGDRRGATRLIPLFAGLCFFIAGVTIAFSLNTIATLPDHLLDELAESAFSWKQLLTSQFLLSARIIFIPALFLSAVLPLCARAFRSTAGSAQSAARVYLANTVGATIGVLTAGFLFLPLLGLYAGLIGGVLACVLIGLGCAILAPGIPRLRPILPVFAIFLTLIWLAFREPWDHRKFALGAYFHPTVHSESGRLRFEEVLKTSPLIVYSEGMSTTVAVLKSHDNTLRYTSNGKVEADSGTRSMINQRLIGHLPMLFHPGEPRNVINLGLGAGVTLGALGQYPGIENLHIVEIEPAVAYVANAFAPYNHNILHHPRLTAYFNDARNFLLTTGNRYDVISSDPFEPVAAGAIHLFTVEHFKLARERLNDDGIMCQWLPMYELSLEDYSALVGTFLSVFPQSLYFSTGNDSCLIGFKDRVRIDPEKITARLAEPAVAASLAEIGFTRPEHFWGMLIADFSVTPSRPPVRPVTDDDPFIEFTAPRRVLETTHLTNREHQLQLFEAGRDARAPSVLEKTFSGDELETIHKHRNAIEIILRAGYEFANVDASTGFASAEEAIALAPDNPLVRYEAATIFNAAGNSLLRQGTHRESIAYLRRAYEYQPQEFTNVYRFCVALLRTGESDAAGALLAQGMQQFPDSPFFFSLQGSQSAELGDFQQALAFHKIAVEKAPGLDHLWEQYERTALIAGDDKALKTIQDARKRFTEQ